MPSPCWQKPGRTEEKVYEAKTTYLSDDLGEDADVAS